MKWLPTFLFSLAGAVAATTTKPLGAMPDWVSWDDASWTLTSTKPAPGTFTAWLSQTNGYMGLTQGSLGPFFELSRANNSEGWPSYSRPRRTFASVSGFWGSEAGGDAEEPRGESFVAGIPHFTDLLVEACGDRLDGSVDVAELRDFVSTLSFSEGVATWSYTWHPPSCEKSAAISVTYESFLSLAERQLGVVKLAISSDSTLDEVAIIDRLDERSALRTTVAQNRGVSESFEITSAVSPTGAESTAAHIVSSLVGDLLLSNASQCHSGLLSPFRGDYLPEITPNTTETDERTGFRRYRLKPGQRSATICKYVGVASTDHFGDQAETVAAAAARNAKTRGYDAARELHSQEVARRMGSHFVADFRDPVTGRLPPDSTIQGLQVAAIASAYYLYTNLLPFDAGVDADSASCQACGSLPVGGLASQAYGGKVFWDADMFMAPAVQGTHPRLARQFGLYRIHRAAQAKQNTERHGLRPGSMLYPWTSGRYGQCFNITGPCVMYQYHLNADIALSLLMARNTSGDGTWFEEHGAAAVVDGVAMGLGEVLSFRNETRNWGIDVMTDADEYYMFVADGSFTSAATSVVLENASQLRQKRGQALEARWAEQTENMALPTSPDGSIVLEFRDMPDTIVSKQADVILAHFPFDYRRSGFDAPSKRRAAMDYYAVRQDPQGPAMTWSLYAIAANTLAPSGCAFWTFLVRSFEPYLRMPWFQYSEQQDDDSDAIDPLTGNGIHPAFPFLTGHGGLLQALTAGFLGLKVTDTNLVLLPSLPPQLRHFKPPVQFYNGAVVGFRMNSTHTEITRLDAAHFDGLVPDQYGAADMPITIGRDTRDQEGHTVHLQINETAVVANRVYHSIPEVPGNVLQCRATASEEAFAPGQYPFAATDGYGGTAWQAASDAAAATLTVDTGALAPRPLRAVHLDFGQRPPRRVQVVVTNSSAWDDAAAATTLLDVPIAPSRAWDAAAPVAAYEGNRTTLALGTGAAWSGAYARLIVEGCWAEDGLGATVAEFALLA